MIKNANLNISIRHRVDILADVKTKTAKHELHKETSKGDFIFSRLL